MPGENPNPTNATGPKPRKRHGCIKVLLVFFGIIVCMIGSCRARWPAKPTGRQKTIVTSDGRRVTFTEWEAERVVKFLFWSDPSAYIEIDGRRRKMHGGGFGFAIGSLLVSPERDRVIVLRAFEGGETSGLEVNLKTGETRWWGLYSYHPYLADWKIEGWGTTLDPLTRAEVHQQLAIPRGPLEMAVQELRARGYEDSDWIAMAKVVADPSAGPGARRRLAKVMVEERQDQANRWRRQARYGSSTMPANYSFEFDDSVPAKVYWPEEIVRLFESVKDDPDPMVREEVRKALIAMSRDQPSTQP